MAAARRLQHSLLLAALGLGACAPTAMLTGAPQVADVDPLALAVERLHAARDASAARADAAAVADAAARAGRSNDVVAATTNALLALRAAVPRTREPDFARLPDAAAWLAEADRALAAATPDALARTGLERDVVLDCGRVLDAIDEVLEALAARDPVRADAAYASAFESHAALRDAAIALASQANADPLAFWLPSELPATAPDTLEPAPAQRIAERRVVERAEALPGSAHHRGLDILAASAALVSADEAVAKR
ncbi:MAG: hypothetical protein H6698_01145 [Myxococcales bacterium]|nr:hypothetical protein [Myxococcales bacterium]MCB9532917.1 hypothetical protein [Myxococcales bacterium]